MGYRSFRIVPVDARRVTGAEVPARLRDIPTLPPDEAEAFAADIERARREVPPPRDAWAS